MGLRIKVIIEENPRSFRVSDKEGYDDSRDIVRYEAHQPVNGVSVVTEHSFGSFGSTKVLDVFWNEEAARRFAHSSAREYAKKYSPLPTDYIDRTSLKDSK